MAKADWCARKAFGKGVHEGFEVGLRLSCGCPDFGATGGRVVLVVKANESR